jgi:hypothetical protein
MDIRFLKQLTPNVGYLFPKHQIHFSQTPAVNIVSLGIGQIIRNHPIYVPIHGLNPLYEISKVCQYGGSDDVIDSTEKEVDKNVTPEAAPDQLKNTNLSTPEDLVKSNPPKRKIDEPIESSFQHPAIKTNVLLLSNKKKLKKGFKFQIID